MRRSSRTRLPERTYIPGDTHSLDRARVKNFPPRKRPRDEYGEEKKKRDRSPRAREREKGGEREKKRNLRNKLP